MKRIPANQKDNRGKCAPNWEGPLIVKKAFMRGAVFLAEMDGKVWTNPTNSEVLKIYYT